MPLKVHLLTICFSSVFRSLKIFILVVILAFPLLNVSGVIAAVPPLPIIPSNVAAPTSPKGEQEITPGQLEAGFGQLPLYFIENRGQIDNRVAYYIQGRETSLYFTAEGVTFVLAGAKQDRHILNLDFIGANPNVRPIGREPTGAAISYFKGSPDHWHTGLPTYARLIYPDLWPGIDLVYSGTVNRLKYEFVVKPGVDPHQIRLAYRGATAVNLNETGQLEVSTPASSFHDDAPYAYQEIDGQQVAVPVAYHLDTNAASSPLPPRSPAPLHSYSFHLSDYDPTQPLIIDPAVLVYAGFIGGSGEDQGTGIAVDTSGNVYVTGLTYSTDFPTVGPIYSANSGSGDAFVAKLNAAGTALIYATYLGGNGNGGSPSGMDGGRRIVVDAAGNAYVVGGTRSTDFPTTPGAFDETHNGGNGDAFVAKLSPSGSALVYSTYLGGDSGDDGGDIAVDADGNVFVVVDTYSGNLPTTPGVFQTNSGGNREAFVAKLNAAGSGLLYATYLGGSGEEQGTGIAIDPTGNAYVTGSTGSTNFPTANPFQASNGGARDIFVTKLNPTGSALIYSTYLGGANIDSCAHNCAAVDASGNLYVTGQTLSTNFPTVNPLQSTFGGGTNTGDAFVAKLNPAGSALIYSTYLGGSGDEGSYDLAIDPAGNAYVTGPTLSPNFPLVSPTQATFGGGTTFGDAFVTKLNAAGSALIYSTYLGGSGDDYGYGIAVDSTGSAYVTGPTASNQSTFPETGGPDLTYNGGTYDAFVAKIISYPNVTGVSPSPNALNITRTADVTATFSEDISSTTITSRTFVVHGDLTGRYTQTLSYSAPGRTATLNPPGAFKPGEVMMVSASSGISSTDDIGLTPYVWQFWAATSGGSGSFLPHPTAPSFGGGQSYRVGLGDLDGDGDLDAVVVNEYQDEETVWLNNGAGVFSSAGSFNAGDNTYDLGLGDLDGDGDLDVVTGRWSGPAGVWFNNGSGVFSAGPTFGDKSDGLALGDIDGDGDLDAVVATFAGQPETVWLNNGAGNFTAHPVTPSFGADDSIRVTLGDLDSDGDLDAIVSNDSATAPKTVWLNDGAGNFTAHPTTPSFGTAVSSRATLGDIDNDGDLDALMANSSGETVWKNDSLGNFSLASSFGAGVGEGYRVSLGDIDGDSDLDAVIANTSGGAPETVWLNNGTGSFTPHPVTPSFGAGNSTEVALGDLDGDGDLDALVANAELGEPETVWLNQNPADLAISKSDSPDPVNAGATLTYTLSITNTGPSTVSSLQVVDTLPTGAVFVGAGGTGWSCSQSSGVVTCTRPSLAVGAAPNIVITTTAPVAAGVITNTATVTGAVIDLVAGNNTVTVTTSINPVSTLIVNSNNDVDDGTCNVTHCSLREAINAANTLPNSQTITFNIPGAGPHTIAPTSELPTITDPVTIDGSTQPGANCSAWPPTLRVELNGSNVTTGRGLWITAGASTIRGLVINRFAGSGILINSNSNIIQCNFIGTNPTGMAASPNGWGVMIASASSENIIGTNGNGVADVAERNLISGNSQSGILIQGSGAIDNRIAGNFIGTNLTGATALSNSEFGVRIDSGASGNLIGTNSDGQADIIERNLINSNNFGGVYIDGVNTANNRVAGNLIGIDITGSVALGNSGDGVTINEAPNTTVGGTTAGAGNTIAYNGEGVSIWGSIGNAVLSNTIFANNFLGINLNHDMVTPNDLGDSDTGPNNLQNFPVLNSVSSSGSNTTIQGTLNSLANTSFTLQFFANSACDTYGYGEGEIFLGSATSATNAGGNASFSVTLPTAVPLGYFITATATDPGNNTSEFSQCLQFTSADLAISKVASSDRVLVGNPLTYTLRITNTGPNMATAISATDSLPTGVTFIGANGAGWNCGEAGGIVTCTRASLGVTPAPDIVITVLAPATSGVITNTATVASNISDPTTPNRAVATTIVEALPLVRFSSISYTVSEGVGIATITATLNVPSSFTATVNYTTSNGTAIAGSDYVTASGVLTFSPGQTSRTFTVSIIDDGLDETDETVNLSLSNPTNAFFGSPNPATLTIVDDDGFPTVQFSAPIYNVGEDAGVATIMVNLSPASGLPATITYTSSNGTALAGSDYVTATGVVTFTPGQTSQSFTVPILNDNLYELAETVTLTLGDAHQAVLGAVNPATLVIVDEDLIPEVRFNQSTYSIAENMGLATITTTLNTAAGITVTVNYATSDGTASAGSDYLAATGVMTFAPGQTQQAFSVTLTNDTLVEPDETVRLTLSNPTNATLSTTNPVTLTIVNDDASAGSRVYLPLILRNSRSPIKLSIKNETGGVLQYSIFGTSQGDITCQNIPNGSTVFCREFLSGLYQATATSTGPGCGSTTATVDFPAGTCTRIVRCGVPSGWQCQ